MSIRPAILDTALYLVAHSTSTTASAFGYSSSLSVHGLLVPTNPWNDKHHQDLMVVLDVQTYSLMSNVTAVGSNFSVDNVSIQATGTVTLQSATTSALIVTMNGTAFTFTTAAGQTGAVVSIGASLAITAATFASNLNAFSGSAVAAATYTANSNIISVTFDTPGSGGNAYTLATNNTGLATVSAGTLTGGTSGLDRITRSSGSFVADGFVAGALVTLASATSSGNNITMSMTVLISSVASGAVTLNNASLMTTDEVFGAATTFTQVASSGTTTFEVQVSHATGFAASATRTVASQIIAAAGRYHFPFDLASLKTTMSGLGSGAHLRVGWSQSSTYADSTGVVYGSYVTKNNQTK